MGRLGQDAFLTELSNLYAKNKDKGSITVVIKRVDPAKLNKSLGKDEKLEVEEGAGPRCLVRAVDSKKRKISTVLEAKDVERFNGMFGNIVKVHMDALKKRAKRRKAAAKKE